VINVRSLSIVFLQLATPEQSENICIMRPDSSVHVSIWRRQLLLLKA